MTTHLEHARAFLAASLVDEGRELREDLDGALAAFEQVLGEDPTHAEALRERARLLTRLGRDALDAWARAASSAPTDGRVQLGLGVALLEAGRFAEALAALDTARALGADAPQWRARTLCELGHFAEALRELDACTWKDDELRLWRAHALASLGQDAQWGAVLATRVHDVEPLLPAPLRRAAPRLPRCARGDCSPPLMPCRPRRSRLTPPTTPHACEMRDRPGCCFDPAVEASWITASRCWS